MKTSFMLAIAIILASALSANAQFFDTPDEQGHIERQSGHSGGELKQMMDDNRQAVYPARNDLMRHNKENVAGGGDGRADDDHRVV